MHSAGPDAQAETGTQLYTLPAVQRLKRETRVYIDFHSAFHGARRQRVQHTEGLDVAPLSQLSAIAGANKRYVNAKKTGAKGQSVEKQKMHISN